MQRHHSLGTATLVALMAAHRLAMRGRPPTPAAPQNEAARILTELENTPAIGHDAKSRIGWGQPIIAVSRLWH
jgi:hypothetical protein